MNKITSFTSAALLALVAPMQAQFVASDSAANYGASWASGSNGGSGFNPWGFIQPGGTLIELADSTAGAGNINSGGVSFRLASSGLDAAEAIRSFGGGSSLSAGSTFSFSLSVNFRNGNKGFDLRNGGDTLFNFNVGGDSYFFGGVDLGTQGFGYTGDGIYLFQFEFINDLTMRASVSRTSAFDDPRFFEIPSVALSNPIDNFKFYSQGTDDTSPVNSLYFNNLQVVPEPGFYGALAGVMALAVVTLRRRRP